MILQRVAAALKSQDWATVFVEFLLVVFGVLVALEVDRYNERLKEQAVEADYIRALQRDIERDVEDLTILGESFAQVEAFGRNAIATLADEPCVSDECWRSLVEMFHASQWADVSLQDATFEEMKRLGLPSDAQLKDRLEQYYALGRQRKSLTQELPEYRELVRSIIPPGIQEHIWKNCFTVKGRFETYVTDCESPVSSEAAREVIREMQQSPEIKRTLTFWLSNLSLTTISIPQQIDDAERVLEVLEASIHGT